MGEAVEQLFRVAVIISKGDPIWWEYRQGTISFQRGKSSKCSVGRRTEETEVLRGL